MRLDAAIGDELVDEASRVFIRAYPYQLDKVSVVESTKHLDFRKKLTAALLIVPLENLHRHFPPIVKSPAIHEPKPAFTHDS